MVEDDGNIFALIKEETELEDAWLKDKEIIKKYNDYYEEGNDEDDN